jgi:beta-glucosidase
VLRGPKNLELQPGDAAVVDTVCDPVAKWVVLVVSGRPQVIAPEQLAKIDAPVASWLPGSQGRGRPDVLFGKQPFTGKRSHTWPASAAQERINAGDSDYHPAFPYGWGLRTKYQDDDLVEALGLPSRSTDACSCWRRSGGAPNTSMKPSQGS